MGHTIKTNGVDHWEIYSTIAEGPIMTFKTENELISYIAMEKAYRGKLEAIREMFLFPSGWVVNKERQFDIDAVEAFRDWDRQVTLATDEERYAMIDKKFDELMNEIKPKYTIFDYEKSKGGRKDIKPFVIKETYTELDVYNLLEIDGKNYAVCMLNPAKNFVGVREITINEKPEPKHGESFVCPYCNDEDMDAWEYTEDKGEVTCGACDSDIKYERDSMKLSNGDWFVEYTVYPVKRTEIIKII